VNMKHAKKIQDSRTHILQQMYDIYTPIIFDLFQHEYQLFEICFVKSINIQTSSFDFVISMARDRGEWQVSFDLD
jgi:hypothetical protein